MNEENTGKKSSSPKTCKIFTYLYHFLNFFELQAQLIKNTKWDINRGWPSRGTMGTDVFDFHSVLINKKNLQTCHPAQTHQLSDIVHAQITCRAGIYTGIT